MFRLRATAVQPSNRRFHPSVHAQSHGRRQDVQIDIFASSTGEFNIISLNHMKKLKNVLSLERPVTLTTIDLASSESLDGMKVRHKPQAIRFVLRHRARLMSTSSRISSMRKLQNYISLYSVALNVLTQAFVCVKVGSGSCSCVSHRIFYVEMAGINHNLDQLFGVRALAHRGLLPFIGGLCGDHSPHRTTMTQTKRCPIF